MTEEYTFTGFMKSGNPFLWYYDANKRTGFDCSLNVEQWDRPPKFGDKIKYEKSGCYPHPPVTERVWINDELVYTRCIKKELAAQKAGEALYNNIRKSKGL